MFSFNSEQVRDMATHYAEEHEAQLQKDITIAKAKKAACEIRPHVYTLTHSTDEAQTKPLTFYILGCAGNATEAQRNVAELMDYIAHHPDNKPKFILILGDNFYDWGVSSPCDPMFKSNFDTIYNHPGLKNIADIPCFVVLGNHDENFHRLQLPLQEKGVDRGMHQVAHSYLPEGQYDTVEKKVALYSRDTLDINTLPKWNMPSRYYSIIDGNTQIFCIDSNTYVSDYLKKDSKENNQAIWLDHEVQIAKAAGRRVLLACHHPLHTPGTRAYESDVDIYLTKNEILNAQLEFIPLKEKDPYNYYFRETLKTQHLFFDAVFSAHDHNISYFNNHMTPLSDYPLCQITAGGGGGKTQKRKKFTTQNQMACFLKEHGFVQVNCDQRDTRKMTFDIHTTNGKYNHHYSNQHIEPTHVFQPSISEEEKQKTIFLYRIIKEAIDEYFSFIGDLQDDHHGRFFKRNVSHGPEGIQRAHDLWAYINNVRSDNYLVTLEKTQKLSEWTSYFSKPSEHSFITILENKLFTHYKKDLAALIKCERAEKKLVAQKVS